MTSVHDDHDHDHGFTAPLDSFTTHLDHHDHHDHHDNYALDTRPLLQEELLFSGVELDGEGLGLHNFEEEEFYDEFEEEEEDDEDEGFDEDDEDDMQNEDGVDRANDGSDEGQGHGEGGHMLGTHDFLYEHHSEFEWLAQMDLSQHDMTQDLSSSMNVVEDESFLDDEHRKSGVFIPRDAENIEKMRNVLVSEFESETKFKSNELDQIEKRMKDLETIWKRLQKSWSGRIYDASLLYEITNDIGGKKKKKRNKNRTNIGNLYARNPDGTFVKLVCPVCKRVDFATQLGFVNHCRIMHRLKFSSYEDATIHCGVPVDESEVPPEDPSRLSKPLSYFVNKKKTEYEPGSPSSGVVYLGERRAESFFERDARSSSDTEDGDQKPYLRKVIVGNTSKALAPENIGADGLTHKWMIYLRGHRETSDISKFVQKVRFYLHPSYKPDDIIEVRAAPFQITRRAKNPAPVRVQIYWADGKTPPTNVVHPIKLDFETIGLQKLGCEQEVVVELDPEFCDKLDQESNSENTFPEHYTSLTGHKRRLEDDTDDGRRKRQKITDNDVGSFLKAEAEARFPLVSEEKSGKLPFSCAKNEEQWNSWSLGKRKSSEWQRARRLRIRLEEELNLHQTEWSTKRIASFLRDQGMTPGCKLQGSYDEMYQQQLLQYEQMKLRKATKKTLAKKIVFCQFCGCAHFPVDQFDELERRCGERKKLLLLSNLSSFADLQARSNAPLPPLTLVPPPRLLAPIAQPKTGHVVVTTGANQQRQLVYITSPLTQQQQNALMLKNQHVVAVPAKSPQPTGPRPIASAGQLPNIAPKPPVLVQALPGNAIPSNALPPNAIIVASDGSQIVPVTAVPAEDKEKKTEQSQSHEHKAATSEPSAATSPAVHTTSATPSTPVNITPTVNNTTTTTATTVNTNTPATPTTPNTTANTNANNTTPTPITARQQPIAISPGTVTHVTGVPIHANNIVQVKTPHGTANAVALPPGAVKVPVSMPGVVAVPAHHAVPVPDKMIHTTPVLSDNEAAWIRTVLAEIGVQVDDESNKLVESVLFKAMMMFTQSLLHECQSVFINERNQDPATEKPFKVMVPHHVLTAILQNKNFDFLTNHGLQKKD